MKPTFAGLADFIRWNRSAVPAIVHSPGQDRHNIAERRGRNMDDETMEAKDVGIRIARPGDISRIAAAYSEWGYGAGIALDDTAWLAEIAGELIGIVRVAPEHGALVLRGMRIAEPWRQLGIGTRMLNAVASWLDGRQCYCVPYAHLVHFYGQIGFVEIANAAAPDFLRSRVTGYKRRSIDVLIMVRSAWPHARGPDQS